MVLFYRGETLDKATVFDIHIKCTFVEKMDGRKGDGIKDHRQFQSDPFVVGLVLKDPPELPPWLPLHTWTKSFGRQHLYQEHHIALKKQAGKRHKRGVNFSEACGDVIGRTEVHWNETHPRFQKPIRFTYNPNVEKHYITFQLYDCDYYTESHKKEDSRLCNDPLVDDLEYQDFICQRTYCFEDILTANPDTQGPLEMKHRFGADNGTIKLIISKSDEKVIFKEDENDDSKPDVVNLSIDSIYRTTNKCRPIPKLKKLKRRRRKSAINADLAILQSDVSSSRDLTASLDSYSLNYDYFQSWSHGKYLFTIGVPESKYFSKNLNLQVIDLETKKVNKDIDEKILGTGDIPSLRRGFSVAYKPDSKELFLFGGVLEKGAQNKSVGSNNNNENGDIPYTYDDSIYVGKFDEETFQFHWECIQKISKEEQLSKLEGLGIMPEHNANTHQEKVESTQEKNSKGPIKKGKGKTNEPEPEPESKTVPVPEYEGYIDECRLFTSGEQKPIVNYGEWPSGRLGHSLCLARGKVTGKDIITTDGGESEFPKYESLLILTGGYNETNNFLEDGVWMFDTENKIWRQSLPGKEPNQQESHFPFKPLPRKYHSSLGFPLTSSKVMIHGGVSGTTHEVSNRTFMFDCVSNAWDCLYPDERETANQVLPPPTCWSSLVVCKPSLKLFPRQPAIPPWGKTGSVVLSIGGTNRDGAIWALSGNDNAWIKLGIDQKIINDGVVDHPDIESQHIVSPIQSGLFGETNGDTYQDLLWIFIGGGKHIPGDLLTTDLLCRDVPPIKKPANNRLLQFTYPDGNRYKGDYEEFHVEDNQSKNPNEDKIKTEQKPHGHGFMFFSENDPHGRLEYEGDFDEGKMDGFGRIKFKDGSTYVGDIRNGLPHGKGLIFNAKYLPEGEQKNKEVAENMKEQEIATTETDIEVPEVTEDEAIDSSFITKIHTIVPPTKSEKVLLKQSSHLRVAFPKKILPSSTPPTGETSDIYEYYGDWKEGLKHGKGRATYVNRSRYEGGWFEDKPNGMGQKHNLKKTKFWLGDFKGGEIVWGKERKYREGTKIESIQSVFESMGKEREETTTAFKEEKEIDDIKTNQITEVFEEEYDGEFRFNGERNGIGICKFKNGDWYDGLWKKGKQNGNGVYFSNATKSTYRGKFVNGICQGKCRIKYSSGVEFDGFIAKNGRLQEPSEKKWELEHDNVAVNMKKNDKNSTCVLKKHPLPYEYKSKFAFTQRKPKYEANFHKPAPEVLTYVLDRHLDSRGYRKRLTYPEVGCYTEMS